MATHVALHAKRAVASSKGALERCGVAASAAEVMMADTVQDELTLTTLACVAVNVDLEQSIRFVSFVSDA